MSRIGAGIAQLHIATAGIRFPAEAEDFSLLHSVQTQYGAYPATCPVGTRGKAVAV
jgi:hypothetical protein